MTEPPLLLSKKSGFEVSKEYHQLAGIGLVKGDTTG